MSRCSDCSLHRACRNPLISGDTLGGGVRPDLMIVQDYPTFFDDRCDSVPSGDTERKLQYLLDAAKINKSRVYFTSAIKCSVKTVGDIKNKNLDACRPNLLQEIKKVRPKLIIVMGKISHLILTEISSVSEFAGHFSDFSFEYEVDRGAAGISRPTLSTKILPTYSLAVSIKKWELNKEIIRHFMKAKEYLTSGLINQTTCPAPNVILSLEQLDSFKKRAMGYESAATDCETTGFEFFRDKIINVGYANDLGVDILYLTPYEEEHIKGFDLANQHRARRINLFINTNGEKIKSVLEQVNSHVKLILHNGKFDSKFTRFNGFPYKRLYADTLIADSLIDENVPHSLNFCLERRGIDFGPYDTKLWQYVNKDENKRKTYQFVPPLILEKYLAYDVHGDWLLWQKQKKELEIEGLLEHFFKDKMPALKMVTHSEYTGFKADKSLIHAVSISIQKKQADLQNKLVRITKNKDFNPNSGKQISEFLVNSHYPLARLKIAETATGYSSSKAELEKFLPYKKYAEFPQALLDYKKLMKIKGTYVDGKMGSGGMLQYLDRSHRIHTNYNMWTPRTSRWSANKPSVQVWPRPIKGLPNARNFVIPTRGWNLFEADYKQLEQCVVAALSKDRALIDKINDNTDLHCFNSVYIGKQLKSIDNWVSYEHMLVANDKHHGILDETTVKELLKDIEKHGVSFDWKEKRTQAKNIGFGLNYGKGAKSFSEEFGISEDEAQNMIDAYFDLYHGMKSWRDKIIKQALTTGVIMLRSGRKRRFTAATDWLNSDLSDKVWSAKMLREEIARQAMNFPVQGGAHEVFEPACVRLANRFKKEGLRARLMLYIHDGLVGECPTEENEAVSRIMSEELTHVFNKDTAYELTLGIDKDFYTGCWYGEKFHLR